MLLCGFSSDIYCIMMTLMRTNLLLYSDLVLCKKQNMSEGSQISYLFGLYILFLLVFFCGLFHFWVCFLFWTQLSAGLREESTVFNTVSLIKIFIINTAGQEREQIFKPCKFLTKIILFLSDTIFSYIYSCCMNTVRYIQDDNVGKILKYTPGTSFTPLEILLCHILTIQNACLNDS